MDAEILDQRPVFVSDKGVRPGDQADLLGLSFLDEVANRRREEVAFFGAVTEMAGLRLGAREERPIAPFIIPLAVEVVRFDSLQERHGPGSDLLCRSIVDLQARRPALDRDAATGKHDFGSVDSLVSIAYQEDVVGTRPIEETETGDFLGNRESVQGHLLVSFPCMGIQARVVWQGLNGLIAGSFASEWGTRRERTPLIAPQRSKEEANGVQRGGCRSGLEK